MHLIIGLGNPGKKYEKTRHNVGFKTLDTVQEYYDFNKWQADKKCQAIVSSGLIADKKTVLCKPQTFMNASGDTARCLMKTLKANAENLVVIHDDTDLAFGKIKISKNRGAAGHKGVSSIIKNLGTKNFVRLRVGVGVVAEKKSADALVLKNFSAREETVLKETIVKILKILELTAKGNLSKAMTEYNQ